MESETIWKLEPPHSSGQQHWMRAPVTLSLFLEITIKWCRVSNPFLKTGYLGKWDNLGHDLKICKTQRETATPFCGTKILYHFQHRPKSAGVTQDNWIFSFYTVCFPSHLLVLSAGTKMLVWERSCCNAVWRLNIKVSLKLQKRVAGCSPEICELVCLF